jgi:hypothetical protein
MWWMAHNKCTASLNCTDTTTTGCTSTFKQLQISIERTINVKSSGFMSKRHVQLLLGEYDEGELMMIPTAIIRVSHHNCALDQTSIIFFLWSCACENGILLSCQCLIWSTKFVIIWPGSGCIIIHCIMHRQSFCTNKACQRGRKPYILK